MSPAPAHRLHGEIESPRPLRARDGFVSLLGWCLVENLPEPPPVRLATPAGILPMTARTERPDLPRLLPGQPAAANAGFTITGRLPAGMHVARFEAQLPDGRWEAFKILSLCVEFSLLVATTESPMAEGTITQRVYVEGWALHPEQSLLSLSLRYGHQDIPCDLGGARPDVSAAYSAVPHATQAVFKSRVILWAGRGPLRVRAKLADGSSVVARTRLTVEVATDEYHDASFGLGAARVALLGYAPARDPGLSAVALAKAEPASARPATIPADASLPAVAGVADPGPASARPATFQAGTSRPLRVLFILPGSFASNSALHVAALANELGRAGHACAVAVPHDPETLAQHPAPLFRGLTHTEAESGAPFPDGLGPDLIHAWTTRENVRVLTEKLRTRHRAQVIVHLEDNERQILSLSLGRDITGLEKLPPAELDRLVPADLSHPLRAREFLSSADGVTVITDRLREFVPAGRPCHTVWPAADARFYYPRPRPEEFRRVLGPAPDTTVLFYHGNVHAANAAEVRELYTAVLQLNRAGTPVTLIRCGLDQVDFLGGMAGEVAPHVLSLGQIPHHHHLPPLMALADIFVQPGAADAFNDYRFPSKLPEFFALGRPVVLPRTNLGTQLRHGTDAYVLDRADAAGIFGAVTELRRNPALHEQLARGAADFAAQHFSWPRSAEALAKFYRMVVQ